MSRLPLVLLLGLTLGFAACGDGDGQDNATPTTAAQPSPTAGETPPAELFGPPFEGELLDIFIGPDLQLPDAIPDTFLKPGEVCPPGTSSVVIPWEQAGNLNLNVGLPLEYVLQEGSLESGAFACGDTVAETIRHYNFRLADGGSADVFIGRSLLRLQNYKVAADRVSTAVFAGREAVVIEPAFPEGRGQLAGPFYGDSERSGVFFPEPFGQTFINAAGLSTENLFKLAQIVAEATSRRTDIPEVDAVLDAVESGDPDRVSALLRFTPKLCGQSNPPYFYCGLDAEEPSLVDVVPISDCKFYYLGRDGLDEALRATLLEPALYGVYKALSSLEPRPYGFSPPAEYIAVFSRKFVTQGGRVLPIRQVLAVAIDQGEIVRVFFATPVQPNICASTPAQIVEGLGLEDAILPPA